MRNLPAILLVFLAACGSSDSGPITVVKQPGAAARVDITASPSATVPAGGAAGSFTVRVADAAGTPVPGVNVVFSAVGSIQYAPVSGNSDANGLVTTQITAGTVVGTATLRGTATNVTTPATVTITVVAGAALKVTSNPKTIRLATVGDTVRIAAAAQDQYGNNEPSSAIAWTTLDATLVSVDQLGLVRALKQGGTTLVIATSGSRADTTAVTVLAAGASVCTGLATAANLAVGQSTLFTGTQYGCVSGSAAGAEFAVVAFNSATDAANALNVSVTGSGIGVPPAQSIAASTSFTSLTADAVASTHGDERLDAQLLAAARTRFGGRFTAARAMRGAAGVRGLVANGPPAISSAVIPPTAKVGDLITMNVSANTCDLPINHAVRVMAIGTKSIVLADTLNPASGFATADFQRFAANFDTLVYPLDVAAFGAPSDIDNNGKVGIIFTRAVNDLVDANSGYFVGGFFNYRDIFPKKGATTADDCAGSNEGEMFYMAVPAPSGINGVSHTVGFVDSLVNGIVAHEFQHLINAERRLYVNTASQDFETVWLGEGLSHIAEELLYYRESGWTPRQNLDDAKIRINNPATYGFFPKDAVSNFNRLGQYLASPGSNSPYANDDALPTRGATWSFLRYSADQLGATDGTLWQKMTNSTSTGLGTLQAAFGTDPTPLFRSWTVANFMDDFAGGTDPVYQHKSWNYRDIFSLTLPKFSNYPLAVTPLTNNVKFDASIRGGSAAYYRMSVAAGKDGLLTFTSGGGAPAAPLQFVVVRTK